MRNLERPVRLGTAMIALAALCVPASVLAATWSRTYGGPSASEGVQDVRELLDGTIAVAAHGDSFGTGTGDGWLLQLTAEGQPLNQHVVGNALPGGVDGAVVLPSGAAVFGSRNVFDIFYPHDGWFAALDPSGVADWSVNVSAAPNGKFFANDLVATADGGILAAGQSSMTDAPPHVGWMIRMDAAGNVLWQQYHGGVVDTSMSFEAAIETFDGGFALAGWTTAVGGGGEDVWVVKTSAGGAITWARAIGSPGREQGTNLVQLADGGYVVTAFGDDFTGSGHAGWVIRLDGDGNTLWHAVLGDAEWGDIYGVADTGDGAVVVLGRVAEAGLPTNDLWALKMDASDGTILWQRAYEGDSGDFGSEVVSLSGGDLLLAGTWAWGFPEESVWLLRTDSEGRIAGCGLVRDTAVRTSSPRITNVPDSLPPPFPPFGRIGDVAVVTDIATGTVETQCDSVACAPLVCLDLAMDPPVTCAGETTFLFLVTSGGEGLVTVEWDLDGDTSPDGTDNPVSAAFPAGTTIVTATATDSCAPGPPQQCSLSLDVTVQTTDPPAEVSDVRGGAPPLLVQEHGDRLVFEEAADAVAYNVHVDAIGSWYAPSPATGSACFVATTPGDPGLLEASLPLPADSWLVVTASTGCSEGPPGADGFGDDRSLTGSWTWCGAAP